MKYTIKKGSSKMVIFILTGFFLIISFSYLLYNYLQTNQFMYEFPGDWDKPLGIAVGVFLIIRSTKFIRESKSLFIKISGDQLIYRTRELDSVRKIDLSAIEKIQEKDDKIILETSNLNKLVIIDFNKVRVRSENKEAIRKSLIELN